MIEDQLNYYKTLKISPNATQAEIKTAYRKLANRYHPDKCKFKNAVEKFQAITKAYQCLCNELTRTQYDKGKYTEERPGSKEDRATALLLKFFGTILMELDPANIKYKDIIDQVKIGLRKDIREGEKVLETVELQLEKHIEAAIRISGKNDLLLDFIESQQNQMKQHILKVESDIKTLEIALKLADDYKYKTDEQEQQNFSVTFSTGTTNW